MINNSLKKSLLSILLVFMAVFIHSTAFAVSTINSATLDTGASVTVSPGVTISAQVDVTVPLGSDWRSTRWLIAAADDIPTSICVNTNNHTDGTFSETFDITAPAAVGTYNVYFEAFSDNGCGTSESSVYAMTGAVTVIASPTTTTLSLSPSPSTYGGSLDITVTVTGGSTTPTGSVDFMYGGTDCSDGTLLPITLTLDIDGHIHETTSYPIPAGTYTNAIRACYVGTSTHAPSNGTVTHTIDKATAILSVAAPSSVPYDGSGHAANVNSSVAAGTISNILTGGAATQTNAGTYAVTADFTPTDTANYETLTNASAGNFVINKITPTLSIAPPSSVLHTGSPQAATVTGSVPGVASNVTYNNSATVPTDAAIYVVRADFAPTDTTNYNSLTNELAGNFEIYKLWPTLQVTNPAVLYNGSQQAAIVEEKDAVPGIVSNVRYDGSLTAPTELGTYAVTANFAPTDTVTYHSLTNASAGTFTISVATPTLSVTNSPIYNGSPQAAVVEGNVPGTASNVTYDGSATVPTDAGTYAITADFTPDDAVHFNSVTGASAGNFIIQKATPTLSVTNSPVMFDLSPHAATVTGSVPGTASNILTGGAATKIFVGTYAVTANFIPADTTNYNSLAGEPAGNFVIEGPNHVVIAAATGNGDITLDSECKFTNWAVKTQAQVGSDKFYSYPYGLVEFTLDCADAYVVITFPGDIYKMQYRKYGPVTPGDISTTAWYDFNGIITAKNQITLHLVDGQLGDDTAEDGIIVDQGGPAQLPAPVPTINEWGMALFMLLTGLGSVYYLKRRRNTEK